MSDDDKLAAILKMVSTIDLRLTSHMEKEEGEIDKIFEAVHQQRDELNRRIDTFMQNMAAYMDKQECIERAFLKREDGSIDVDGHHQDHLTRHDFAQWALDVKRDVVRTGVKAALLGFLTWAGYALWAAFLQGPKG